MLQNEINQMKRQDFGLIIHWESEFNLLIFENGLR